MPFIEKVRRLVIDECGITGLVDPKPGDVCYVYYRDMVRRWKINPRWATAHEIYKEVLTTTRDYINDGTVAHLLAWQVFFQLHILPYELEKRKENGDV